MERPLQTAFDGKFIIFGNRKVLIATDNFIHTSHNEMSLRSFIKCISIDSHMEVASVLLKLSGLLRVV